MDQYSDTELLTRLKEDSQSAFEVIFLRHYAHLTAYAATILGDKVSGEEIVQDVFVKIWEGRQGMTMVTSLKSYLYRTVHNHCLNQLESRRVREQYSKTVQAQYSNAGYLPFSGDYPIANLIVKELEAKVQESVQALPDQCREVFYLIRVKDLSYHEVAKRLNISVNTVKTQMSRALFKLREMLQEYLPLLIFLLIKKIF